MTAVPRHLRVAVVCPHAVLGGQESWLLQLLDATDRLHVDAVLLQDGPLRAELEQRGIAVTVIVAGTKPADMVAPILRLARWLRETAPDVLLANGVKAQVVAGPAGRLAAVPIVWAKHDHSFDGPVTRLLARLADRVIGTVEDVLEATGRSDAVVVVPPRPAGKPANRAAARAALARSGVLVGDAPTLVMATRLVAYKGVDDAIAALARPAAQEWRLVVVGGDDPAEPTERTRLEGLAARLGVADRVQLADRVPDLPRLLAAFDALALLTKPVQMADGRRTPGREGFGMVALEAMLAGVPVVAVADSPAARRLAGQAGRVVPAADPDAVATALGELGAPDVRRAAGKAGRALSAGHPDARACADLLASVLADAAARPGAGGAPADAVSVVVPVFNEGAGVAQVGAALLPLLREGDELVLVDDGSTDDTIRHIAALAAADVRVVALSLPANGGPSAARNAGVRAARNELIACTDAGNEPDPDWLDGMRRALADALPTDLVMGAYRVSSGSAYERAMAVALYGDVAEMQHPSLLVRAYAPLFGRAFDPTRPAGRSMAFRRSAWTRVGGWPEQLRTGEDVAFGLAVAASGGRCVLQTEGPMTWVQHSSLAATARMYYGYGRGDGRLGERTVVARNLARAAAAVVGPLLALRGGRAGRAVTVAGAATYLSLPLLRARRQPEPARVIAWVPVVLATKDLAKALGCLRGMAEARRARSLP